MHGTHTHRVGTDNFSFHLMILLLLVATAAVVVVALMYFVLFSAVPTGARKHILLQKRFLAKG